MVMTGQPGQPRVAGWPPVRVSGASAHRVVPAMLADRGGIPELPTQASFLSRLSESCRSPAAQCAEAARYVVAKDSVRTRR